LQAAFEREKNKKERRGGRVDGRWQTQITGWDFFGHSTHTIRRVVVCGVERAWDSSLELAGCEKGV
jgi:hypothetical protein